MESLAMGIPVVASNVGGMGELVVDGKTGYLCGAVAVDYFAEKVTLLAKERELCKELGANARLYAERHFDIRSTIASFANVFQALLAGSLAPLSQPTHRTA